MPALTLPGDAAGIGRAAERILRGGICAYPTETLYGLAARARDPAALARLLTIKGRAEAHAISLLVADLEMLAGVIDHLPELAGRLIARHWPGPLTLVLPAARDLPPPLVGPGGGVGVRVSSDPVAAALVRAVGEPITATSANRSGEAPATCAAEAALLSGIELCLDGGERGAAPSTVVEILGASPRVIRAGVLSVAELLR
jgi:L-threonylcarbamoyladenylate synthase